MNEMRYGDIIFDVPTPYGKGVYLRSTRLRLISDGIGSCIAHLQPEQRGIATNLQYAWMQIESIRRLEASTPPQGVFECTQ
jgi:hypothetical protein